MTGFRVLEQAVVIPNRRGLHARAAAKFVTVSERFNATVEVVFDGQVIPGASIMGLMMLGAGRGAAVTIRTSGEEAQAALDALVALVEVGFNEAD